MPRKSNKKLHRKGHYSSPFHRVVEDRYFQQIRAMAEKNRKPRPEEKAMIVVVELCNPKRVNLTDLQKEYLRRKRQEHDSTR